MIRCPSGIRNPSGIRKMGMSVTVSTENAEETARYRVTSKDCAACAAKIEKAVRSAGVKNVKVSTATQIMTLHGSDLAARLSEVERAVSGIGYQLDRLDGPKAKKIGRASCRERVGQYV